MADQASPTSSCPTCGGTEQVDGFYAGSRECRPCKRDRSRRNRALTALKVELADRLLDIVDRLANEGLLRELAGTNGRGPASDATAARPLSESQEIAL